MKTNALLMTCAALLGALLMLMSVLAFGATNNVQAQDKGDESKNQSSGENDYTALAVMSGSNQENLVVLRNIPSEHPYMREKYPIALAMGVYSFEMNGNKAGKIHLIGSRYIDQDLAYADLPVKGTESGYDIYKNLLKYQESVAKLEKSAKTR